MLHNKLKGFRASVGMTQPQVAKQLNMTTKSYNHKENAKTRFYIEEVSKIAKIMEMTLEDVNEIFFAGKLTKRIS